MRTNETEKTVELTVNVSKATAERLAAIAAGQAASTGEVLASIIKNVVAAEAPGSDPNRPIPTCVCAEIEDRLKHECAFHNPKHQNPTEIMNDILRRYFAFVDAVRA